MANSSHVAVLASSLLEGVAQPLASAVGGRLAVVVRAVVLAGLIGALSMLSMAALLAHLTLSPPVRWPNTTIASASTSQRQ